MSVLVNLVGNSTINLMVQIQRQHPMHLPSQPGVKRGAVFWAILGINQNFLPANWLTVISPKGPESNFSLAYLENSEEIQIHSWQQISPHLDFFYHIYHFFGFILALLWYCLPTAARIISLFPPFSSPSPSSPLKDNHSMYIFEIIISIVNYNNIFNIVFLSNLWEWNCVSYFFFQ